MGVRIENILKIYACMLICINSKKPMNKKKKQNKIENKKKSNRNSIDRPQSIYSITTITTNELSILFSFYLAFLTIHFSLSFLCFYFEVRYRIVCFFIDLLLNVCLTFGRGLLICLTCSLYYSFCFSF